MRSCRSSFVIINMCTRFLLAWSNWCLYPECNLKFEAKLFLSISIYWKVVLWDGESGGSPPALGISARGWARWWASPTRSSSVCSATRSSRPRRSRRPTWPPGTGSHSRGPSTKACAASTPEWGGEKFPTESLVKNVPAIITCNSGMQPFYLVNTNSHSIVRKTLLVVSFNVCLVEINCFSWIWQKSIFRWWYAIWGGGAESTATKGEGDAPKIQLCLEVRRLQQDRVNQEDHCPASQPSS